LLPAASLLLATACSSGSFEVASTSDATTDADASDGAQDVQVVTNDTSTPGDTGTFECRDPGNCGPLKPHCCASFTFGAGPFPQCPMTAADTKCQTTCQTAIPTMCSSNGRVKVCRNANDCLSDPTNPKCCNVLAGGLVGTVCVSAVVANATGATCTN
jgi:hypothetical protein